MMHKKAFIMNRIGDLGLLIGIFIGSLFHHFRLCHFKTAITGATDLDMYWISAAAALFIGAVENQHKFHCIPGCQMQVLLLFQH
jgi:NADH:ubiquinone oxidoreductase subunit 5 (subunit L)/multisubunit Na+/H+ antiporter MnhA subunit